MAVAATAAAAAAPTAPRMTALRKRHAVCVAVRGYMGGVDGATAYQAGLSLKQLVAQVRSVAVAEEAMAAVSVAVREERKELDRKRGVCGRMWAHTVLRAGHHRLVRTGPDAWADPPIREAAVEYMRAMNPFELRDAIMTAMQCHHEGSARFAVEELGDCLAVTLQTTWIHSVQSVLSSGWDWAVHWILERREGALRSDDTDGVIRLWIGATRGLAAVSRACNADSVFLRRWLNTFFLNLVHTLPGGETQLRTLGAWKHMLVEAVEGGNPVVIKFLHSKGAGGMVQALALAQWDSDSDTRRLLLELDAGQSSKSNL